MSYAAISDIRALGITAPVDAVVQNALDIASELVDSYTGTTFSAAVTTTKTFYDQRTKIVALPLPVTDVTEIDVSGYTLSAAQFQLDGQILRLFPIYMRDGSGFPLIGGGDFANWAYDSGRSSYGYDIAVTGTWGWASIPVSAMQATLLIAQDQLSSNGTNTASYDPAIRSLSVEAFSVSLADTTTMGATTGNTMADRLLERFRVTRSGIL